MTSAVKSIASTLRIRAGIRIRSGVGSRSGGTQDTKTNPIADDRADRDESQQELRRRHDETGERERERSEVEANAHQIHRHGLPVSVPERCERRQVARGTRPRPPQECRATSPNAPQG